MKWFIVVVMMWQPSGHTPLWIPYVSFETENECMVHAVQNQHMIFRKAIEAHDGEIPPQQISCVREDIMKGLIQPVEEQMEEDRGSV